MQPTFSEALKAGLELARSRSKAEVLLVSVSEQALYLISADNHIQQRYSVSTSRHGVGNCEGSNQTPLGLHRIAEKIGADSPIGTQFIGRKPTGECVPIELGAVPTGQDAITSRILWLQGLEPSVNSGEGIDSYLRYIYIHGTHEEGLIGQPASIGCVRMKNLDVIELFEQIDEGTLVYIAE